MSLSINESCNTNQIIQLPVPQPNPRMVSTAEKITTYMHKRPSVAALLMGSMTFGVLMICVAGSDMPLTSKLFVAGVGGGVALTAVYCCIQGINYLEPRCGLNSNKQKIVTKIIRLGISLNNKDPEIHLRQIEKIGPLSIESQVFERPRLAIMEQYKLLLKEAFETSCKFGYVASLSKLQEILQSQPKAIELFFQNEEFEELWTTYLLSARENGHESLVVALANFKGSLR